MENTQNIHPTYANISHTPLNVDDHIYSHSTDKANSLNDYFTEQSSLDDTHVSLATDLQLPDYLLDSVTATPYAIESNLSSLQLGKAAGLDTDNNRFLKKIMDVI